MRFEQSEEWGYAAIRLRRFTLILGCSSLWLGIGRSKSKRFVAFGHLFAAWYTFTPEELYG